MCARDAGPIFAAWLLVAGLAAAADPAVPNSFELRDGDRVVLLGGTFIEREGQFGYIETALTAAFPERNITFRNLGWSGDTVWADSRGIFDPPAAGYKRMIDLVKELQPTVILLAYGQNESFAGETGLEAFVKQYQALCDDLSATSARLVFLTPLPLHSAEPAVPALASANANVELYSAAIRKLGMERGSVVDLGRAMGAWLREREPQGAADSDAALFVGVHLSPEGYRHAAQWFCQAAELPTPPDLNLDQYQELRRKIVDKNTLFFHRWRPQNITYLFLFRKHEQGNNAVDIPEFDKLTEAADREIQHLLQSTAR